MMFLTVLPLWISGILLIGLPILVAMSGPVLIRRRVSLERLSTNNEVAGFKFATIGVLYAVLLAFAVIVVWEKFSDAENSVAEEAGAAATIYRLSDGIEGTGVELRERLNSYLHVAIADDWPAMERGGASPAATDALSAIYASVLTYYPPDQRGAALLAEILHQLNVVTQARRVRLVLAAGIVPGVVWFVLFGGAVLTIGFSFFFATESLRAQALMTGALTALIFSGLLIIVAIDRPFAGTVKVAPEPLAAVLHQLGSAPRPPLPGKGISP
jgi:hypothetical protein